MNGSGSIEEGALVPALVLFACSAKLWLALNFDNRADGTTGQRVVVPSKMNDDVTTAATPPSSSSSPTTSPLLSPPPPTTPTGGGGGGARFRRIRSDSKEDRRLLMERVSHSDFVLTREVSQDFHPKNSNWSHFDKYAVGAPRRDVIVECDEENDGEEEDGEGEEFLWSEPSPEPSSTGHCGDRPRSASVGDPCRRSVPSSTTSSPSLSDDDAENSSPLPSKLILIRHGQAEGNVDELLYATKPDNAMRITKLGWEMARAAGKALREQLPPDETVHFIVSPYARTVETFHGLVSAWCDPEGEEFASITNRSERLRTWYTRLMEMGLTWHEDPRIREQDFGNYQDPQLIKKAKSERHRFGSFYYRFSHGESASDVFDRVSTFLDSLWRSFESGRAQNYVLVAHGISIRVFLTRYFRYSIDQFHMLANPKNCEMIVLGRDGGGRMKLDGRCELELGEREEEEEEDGNDDGGKKDARGGGGGGGGEEGKKKGTTTTVVTGYKKRSKLRTLPPQYVQARSMRMCYNDN